MDKEQIILYALIIIAGIVIAFLCAKITEWSTLRRSRGANFAGFMIKLIISVIPLFAIFYICKMVEMNAQGPMITMAVVIAIFQMAIIKFRKEE